MEDKHTRDNEPYLSVGEIAGKYEKSERTIWRYFALAKVHPINGRMKWSTFEQRVINKMEELKAEKKIRAKKKRKDNSG